MMTLTPQLKKIAIKKRASHPSSIREPDLDFRKLVDKLEQAEVTMKLEETENLKLQYVNRIETNTTHITTVLPIEIKSDWKRFTQEFSKMFDSERNKHYQRVLFNEIRRLPNETIKQLAVRIETLVRKAYPLNTHFYKKIKMTKILTMTLTHQKTAIRKRASHRSSIREQDLDFRKLVDKLEQA